MTSSFNYFLLSLPTSKYSGFRNCGERCLADIFSKAAVHTSPIMSYNTRIKGNQPEKCSLYSATWHARGNGRPLLLHGIPNKRVTKKAICNCDGIHLCASMIQTIGLMQIWRFGPYLVWQSTRLLGGLLWRNSKEHRRLWVISRPPAGISRKYFF